MNFDDFNIYKVFEKDVEIRGKLPQEFDPEEDFWVFDVIDRVHVGFPKRFGSTAVLETSVNWFLEIKGDD